jgi:uncharacterized membrane protein
LTQKKIKWITEELPLLVEKGIITDQQSKTIREYYEQKNGKKPNVALIAFSIIGSTLLAAGIILILAHNWSNLSRAIRICISYMPLVISQLIGFWVIVKKRDSDAWTEGIAAFGFLAIGATLSLVSQTYHIQGDFRSFIFNWLLLGFPLVYLYRSTTAAVFYIVSVTAWAIAENFAMHSSLGYWPLMALIFPYYIMKYKNDSQSKTVTIIGWFISLSLVFGVFWAINDITEGYKVISLIALFLGFLSIGLLYFHDEESFWKVPFSRVGLIGLSIVYIFLSYQLSWGHLSFKSIIETHSGSSVLRGINYVVSILFPITALILAFIAGKKKQWPVTLYAAGLPLALIGFAVSKNSIGMAVITFVFNAYVFCCGLLYLRQGIKNNSSKSMNYGFVMIAGIVILRFFDTDLTFITRGLIFIVLGLSFLMANIYLSKRKAANK